MKRRVGGLSVLVACILLMVSSSSLGASVSSDGGIAIAISYNRSLDECPFVSKRLPSDPSDVDIEWDCARDKLEADLDELARYIYEISLGKHYLKRVFVSDESRGWDNADIQLYFEPNEKIGDDIKTSRCTGNWTQPHGYLKQFYFQYNSTSINTAHEFAHYFYLVPDEYTGTFKGNFSGGGVFDVTVTEECTNTFMTATNNTAPYFRFCDETNHSIGVSYTHPTTSEFIEETLTPDLVGTADEGPLHSGSEEPFATDEWSIACHSHVDLCGHHTPGVWPEIDDDFFADMPTAEIVHLGQTEDDAPGKILLLDRSGSMSHEEHGRPASDYVQEAGLFLYFSSNLGDFIGVKVYNHEVEDLYPYAQYDASEPDVEAFYPPDDLTNIHLALEEAIGDLTAEHQGDVAGAEIYLMSDGKQTTGDPLIEQVNIAAANGIIIHTFSYGDADAEVMEMIADQTQGKVTRMSMQDENPNGLKLKMIKRIAEQLDLTPVYTHYGDIVETGTLPNGRIYHELSFYVPSSTDGVSFYLLPEFQLESQYAIEITDALGVVHNHTIASSSETMGRFLGKKFSSSATGEYKVRVFPTRNPTTFPDGEVQLVAYIDNSNIHAVTWLDQDVIAMGDSNTFYVYGTVWNNYDLTGLQPTSYFYTEEGAPITSAALFDDGTNGDLIAHDGIFTGVVDVQPFQGLSIESFNFTTRFDVTLSSTPAYNSLYEISEPDDFDFSDFQPSEFTVFAEKTAGLSSGVSSEQSPYIDTNVSQYTHYVRGNSYGEWLRICNAMPDKEAIRVDLGQGITLVSISNPVPNGDCFEYYTVFQVDAAAESGTRDLVVQFYDFIKQKEGFVKVGCNALFVANGYYSQEDDFIDYLSTTKGCDVNIKKDYRVKGSTALDGYDLIVVTGFAPNISYWGVQNISSSGVPILIIEYWDFIYSHKFGLLSDNYGFFGNNVLDILDSGHPITQGLAGPIDIYNPSYYAFGVGTWNIESGVRSLIGGPQWGQITVLADDAGKIVATGLYETSYYTAEAWEILSRSVDFLL
ncbi:MAG: VWA domain-containing protein [Deltaproteobacteria bacterium]|nr:VWA domain-containing protein [Deltaproteobacteria bacterium]